MMSSLNRLLASAATALLLVAGCSHRPNLGTETGQLRFGVKAARMNLWREARFRFERAMHLDPNDAMLRNNLAVAYEATGEFDKAREQYIEALRIDPSDQHIQKNFSRFTEYYTKNRKKEEAPAAPPKTEVAPSTSPAATEPAKVAAPQTPPPATQPPAQNPPAQTPAQEPPPQTPPPTPQVPPPTGGVQ